MQEDELRENSKEQNDRLISDLALTRRQSRSLYRHWAVLSKKATGNIFQSQTNVFAKISTSSIRNDSVCSQKSSSTNIEDRADEIVRHLEQSQTLMDDNPKSNNDRIETLRDMTEYLTLKRCVKRKLGKSICCTSKTLSSSKRLKYRISIFFTKIPVAIKYFLSSFELWYSSLKVIEGHFGGSVASYFEFLRKLFILDACIFFIIFFFVLIPQLLFRFTHYVEDYENSTILFSNESEGNSGKSSTFNFFNEGAQTLPLVMMKSNPYEENGEFRLGNIFTGEGFLSNTILFYGYYTNTSLKLFEGHGYSIPASYFFSAAVSYGLIFLFLFISVAVSYRKCYIEASGGMNNSFSNKIFCGWDFGIVKKQAAELKSKSIYSEIKELVDELSRPPRRKSCVSTFYTTAVSCSLNGILLFLLGVGGVYSWKYLDEQMTKADTATTMMIWLLLTLLIALAPVLFSLITKLEGFESPSFALYMTLFRTFTVYAIVIAMVVAYRIKRSNELECWETVIGQDMYRLVLLDFIFGLIGTSLSEFIRYRIFVKMWKGIGCPEFDIARGTMNLIYNQTLFYIGLYFSPVLSLIITIKMFFTFYIKKWGAIYNCKPFVKPWKASQAHTVYLSIAFLAFFGVVIAYGYIITSVKTSNCGPFRGGKLMYETLLSEILANKDSTILMAFYYITRPGVVGIVLMAMVLGVYYMRAVALARIHVVNHLRQLLRLKGEDRKLLLNEISKYSKNQNHPEFKRRLSHPEQNFDGSNPNYYPRLSKSIESLLETDGTHGGLANSEGLKKFKFSSVSNLQYGIERKPNCQRNKNAVFSSVQNISSTADFDRSIELKKHKFSESNQRSGFKPESGLQKALDLEGNDTKASLEETESKEPISRALNEEDLCDRNPTKPNFNPVFTESFPDQSDDNMKYTDVVDNETSDRSPFPNERHPSVETEIEYHDVPEDSVRSFIRSERHPSRINFESDSKKSKRKKNN